MWIGPGLATSSLATYSRKATLGAELPEWKVADRHYLPLTEPKYLASSALIDEVMEESLITSGTSALLRSGAGVAITASGAIAASEHASAAMSVVFFTICPWVGQSLSVRLTGRPHRALPYRAGEALRQKSHFPLVADSEDTYFIG